MKKQSYRQSNGSKSQSAVLKDRGAITSSPAQLEAGEHSAPCDDAVELIRAQAYRLFESRGRRPGHSLDDWLQAEREVLRQSASGEDRGF